VSAPTNSACAGGVAAGAVEVADALWALAPGGEAAKAVAHVKPAQSKASKNARSPGCSSGTARLNRRVSGRARSTCMQNTAFEILEALIRLINSSRSGRADQVELIKPNLSRSNLSRPCRLHVVHSLQSYFFWLSASKSVSFCSDAGAEHHYLHERLGLRQIAVLSGRGMVIPITTETESARFWDGAPDVSSITGSRSRVPVPGAGRCSRITQYRTQTWGPAPAPSGSSAKRLDRDRSLQRSDSPALPAARTSLKTAKRLAESHRFFASAHASNRAKRAMILSRPCFQGWSWKHA